MRHRGWTTAAAALAAVAAASPAHAALDGEFVRKLCVADGTYLLSAAEDAEYAGTNDRRITYRREQPLPVRVYQFEQRPNLAPLCTVVFQSSRDGVICEEAVVAKSGLSLTMGGWTRLTCPSQQ